MWSDNAAAGRRVLDKLRRWNAVRDSCVFDFKGGSFKGGRRFNQQMWHHYFLPPSSPPFALDGISVFNCPTRGYIIVVRSQSIGEGMIGGEKGTKRQWRG